MTGCSKLFQEISIVSSDDEGNTNSSSRIVKCNPAKHWVFTLNNYKDQDILDICSICSRCSSFYIFGKEIGENGTHHLQGFISFKAKTRPKNLFTDRIHWEVARGNRQQNIDYCKKDGNYCINGKWVKPLKILKYEDLYGWQKDVVDMIKNDPDDRKIHYYYEYNGGVGKTSLQKHLVVYHGATVVSGKGADMKYGVLTFNDKKGYPPDIVCVNICRSIEKISWSGIEEIKDGLFFSGKYESCDFVMNSPWVLVFSNNLPPLDKLSHDKWEIHNLNPQPDPCDTSDPFPDQ